MKILFIFRANQILAGNFFRIFAPRESKKREPMIDKTTLDFIILLLILGGIAFVVSMFAHILKRRRRRRMIDPIDHRRWNK